MKELQSTPPLAPNLDCSTAFVAGKHAFLVLGCPVASQNCWLAFPSRHCVLRLNDLTVISSLSSRLSILPASRLCPSALRVPNAVDQPFSMAVACRCLFLQMLWLYFAETLRVRVRRQPWSNVLHPCRGGILPAPKWCRLVFQSLYDRIATSMVSPEYACSIVKQLS